MEVRITLEKRASDENKHLMSFLHTNVEAFRKDMQMSISLMAPADMKTNKVQLPMVQIGHRQPVSGGKNIISEIRQAYDTISQMSLQDPVEQFWREGIKKGPDEKPERSSGDDDMASRFTLETQHRKKAEDMRRSRGGSRPISSAPESASAPSRGRAQPANRPAPGRAPPASATRAPQSTTERIMQEGAGGAMTTADYDNPVDMETDPFMKKFWANQMITAGT